MVTPMPIYRAKNLDELNAELSIGFEDIRAPTLKRLRYLYHKAESEAKKRLNIEGDQECAYLSYSMALKYLNMSMNSDEYEKTPDDFKERCKRRHDNYSQYKLALALELEERYQEAANSDHHHDDTSLDEHSSNNKTPDADARPAEATIISTDSLSQASSKTVHLLESIVPTVNKRIVQSANDEAIPSEQSVQPGILTNTCTLPQIMDVNAFTNLSTMLKSIPIVTATVPHSHQRTTSSYPRILSSLTSLTINHLRQASIQTKRQDNHECAVCLTDKPGIDFEQIFHSTCNHIQRQICTECVRQHILSVIGETHLVDIRCPEFACRASFDFDIVQQLLMTSNTFATDYKAALDQYEDQLTITYLDKMENFIWCAHGCGWGGQLPTHHAPFFTCDCCEKKTCIIHKSRWHDEMSCEEYDNKLKLDVEEASNRLWKQQNTKSCPNCQVAIEKNQGCDHMTCRSCKHDFCWLCFVDYKLIRKNGAKGHQRTCTYYKDESRNRDEIV